jgi:subfamily B ATP-binding cassette protein MsbA
MVLAVPLSLVTAILTGFAVKQLLSKPSFLPWENLLGAVIAPRVRIFLADSSFSSGLSVSQQAHFIPWILVGAAFCTGLLRFLQDYFLEDIGERIARDLRERAVGSFLSLNYVSAIKVREGLLPSFFGDDSREIRLAFTSIAGQIPANALQATVFLAWLMILDFQLFLLFSAVLLPAGVVIRITGKSLRRLSRQGLDMQTDLLGALLEKLRGWQTIRIYDAIPHEMKRFDEFNSRLFHAWRRAARAKALGSPVVEWLAVIAAAMIAVAALRRIAEQEMASEIFAVFLATVAILANALQMMTSMINGSKKGLEAFRRLADFLHYCELNCREQSAENIGCCDEIETLALENLAVAHPENGNLLCSGLNITLRKGDTCAIMGPSGTGKSTLFRVLLGLERAAGGSVRINGLLPKENDYARWGSSIVFLPQEPFIVDGSILENVVYPHQPELLSPEQKESVQRALERVNLQKMPDESVTGLSGGEKQRLAFARVFFSRPSVVFVDEGTSALDLSNEKSLLEALREGAENRISLIIAHRPMVREFASHVLNLSSSTS